MELIPVHIAGTGSHLPGPPIPNDRLEHILGELSNAPPKVRGFVQNLGERLINRGGVQARHFAIDPETRNLTETNASLAEKAARKALEMANMDPKELDLILISCPTHDHPTPPTSALLQERLGTPACAEIEVHSNCCGVGKCAQIAFDSIRCGRYKTALVTYSQLSSIYLRSCYFKQEKMDKVHAALRWILADGSGALVLRAAEKGENGHEMLDTFVESIGYNRAPGMTAGIGLGDLVDFRGQIVDVHNQGNHHLWQDFNAVNRDAGPLLLQGITSFCKRMGVEPSTIDHFVVSIPTAQLYKENLPRFAEVLGIHEKQAKFRSQDIGYCGGAATVIHLDHMVRSGEIQPGQAALVHAVESSKWMTGGFFLRW
jgi:3-oxoacyl-[acyl-carrier-protein] synthase-3